MSTAHPLGSAFGHTTCIEHVLLHLHAAFVPIRDEENEEYFDRTTKYINRDDDEDEDDADDYLDDDDDDDIKDGEDDDLDEEDDLG
jgi:hypothetical protein